MMDHQIKPYSVVIRIEEAIETQILYVFTYREPCGDKQEILDSLDAGVKIIKERIEKRFPDT
ncbi:MAG: hypothetical protein ACFFG0_04770 [Candidatus Thorarchaeota archaeon]